VITNGSPYIGPPKIHTIEITHVAIGILPEDISQPLELDVLLGSFDEFEYGQIQEETSFKIELTNSFLPFGTASLSNELETENVFTDLESSGAQSVKKDSEIRLSNRGWNPFNRRHSVEVVSHTAFEPNVNVTTDTSDLLSQVTIFVTNNEKFAIQNYWVAIPLPALSSGIYVPNFENDTAFMPAIAIRCHVPAPCFDSGSNMTIPISFDLEPNELKTFVLRFDSGGSDFGSIAVVNPSGPLIVPGAVKKFAQTESGFITYWESSDISSAIAGTRVLNVSAQGTTILSQIRIEPKVDSGLTIQINLIIDGELRETKYVETPTETQGARTEQVRFLGIPLENASTIGIQIDESDAYSSDPLFLPSFAELVYPFDYEVDDQYTAIGTWLAWLSTQAPNCANQAKQLIVALLMSPESNSQTGFRLRARGTILHAVANRAIDYEFSHAYFRTIALSVIDIPVVGFVKFKDGTIHGEVFASVEELSESLASDPKFADLLPQYQRNTYWCGLDAIEADGIQYIAATGTKGEPVFLYLKQDDGVYIIEPSPTIEPTSDPSPTAIATTTAVSESTTANDVSPKLAQSEDFRVSLSDIRYGNYVWYVDQMEEEGSVRTQRSP